jgi:hypothetical protein
MLVVCLCSLDADGFPTAESQLASAVGLQEEASEPGEGLVEAQMLLLEQHESLYEEDGAASVMSGAAYQVRTGSCWVAAGVSWSGTKASTCCCTSAIVRRRLLLVLLLQTREWF